MNLDDIYYSEDSLRKNGKVLVFNLNICTFQIDEDNLGMSQKIMFTNDMLKISEFQGPLLEVRKQKYVTIVKDINYMQSLIKFMLPKVDEIDFLNCEEKMSELARDKKISSNDISKMDNSDEATVSGLKFAYKNYYQQNICIIEKVIRSLGKKLFNILKMLDLVAFTQNDYNNNESKDPEAKLRTVFDMVKLFLNSFLLNLEGCYLKENKDFFNILSCIVIEEDEQVLDRNAFLRAFDHQYS